MNHQETKVVPSPNGSSDSAHDFPVSEIEKLIEILWSEILDIDTVGANDDFLELGGNSVQAMQVISRLRLQFGIDVPWKAFFDGATPAGLARALIENLKR